MYDPMESTVVKSQDDNGIAMIAGIACNSRGAVQLATTMMHAGSILHKIGLIHCDIKQKNIMLSNGHVVVIDFGFSVFCNETTPNHNKKAQTCCVTHPGRVKGEVGYVLAKDVAAYRACQQGDVYAMGKTLYQVLYGHVPPNG